MDYSNFSIKNFCDIIYCDSRTMYKSSDISSVDMYSFIKHKTDNFNLNSFEYFIQDLRDYYKHVEICLKNPDIEPEIENNTPFDFRLSYINFELGNVKFIVTYCPVLKIEEKLTLIERIELHTNLISGSFIDHNYSKLKKFSDIAEKQYISVLNNSINEKELEILKLHNTSISFNKPIDELSSDEFVNKCYFEYVPILDAYNYIKSKTDNFNKREMELFFTEFLVHISCFDFTIKVDTQIKTFNIYDYFTSDLFEHKLSDPEILKKGPKHKQNYQDPETGLYYLIVGFTTLNSIVDYIDDIEEDLNFEHNIQTLLELENKLVYEYEIRYGSIDNFLKSLSELDNNENIISKNSNIDSSTKIKKATSKINQSNPELTLAHIALICYYQNIIINTSNAESILKEFNNPSTPKKIIEKYNHFMQKNNRVGCDETKADKAKHKRHLEVVQYLKNNNLEHESAVSDLEILQRNMNTSKY